MIWHTWNVVHPEMATQIPYYEKFRAAANRSIALTDRILNPE